ncbi:DNA (cytosine-5-)-methyltransferase [Mesoplasma syrphidae]|nr:DNA (cytosine-5-)-methyltransferase [Mesoplasma syrphidae]
MDKIIKKKLKFIDLFSGIGGFHLAAENFSFNSNEIELKCILASEIDPFAKIVYSKNYNWDIAEIKNIREINENDIENFNILFGGFPCQAFSNAGKKQGFKDQVKGTLFFDIVRIIDAKKPDFFLLENVKHLVKHDFGKTFETINKTINEMGYLTTSRPLILNSVNFGSLQKRERVYIVGVKKGNNAQEKIDQIANDLKNINLKRDSIEDFFLKSGKPNENLYLDNKRDIKILVALKAWEEFIQNVKFPANKTLPVIWLDSFNVSIKDRVNYTKNFSEWRRKYYTDMWDIYDNNKTFIDIWMRKHKTKNWAKRERKFEWQAGKDAPRTLTETFIQLRQSGIRCRKKEYFPTLVAMVQMPLFFDKNIDKWRYLSSKEAALLQDFNFSNPNKKFLKFDDIINNENKNVEHISNKQFGNAVNVKVIEKIIERILEDFKL